VSEIEPRSQGDAETGDMEAAERLLLIAGPRTISSDERVVRVRSRVQAHWDAGIRRRRARRKAAIGTGLLAAAAALVLIAVRVDEGTSTPTATIVARVARINGSPDDVRRGGGAVPLAVDDAVLVGESIETRNGGRVALRFTDGTSLRLDVASRVRVTAPRALELSSGAVYVDTGGTSARFEIRTSVGTVRDVGTQFEVRLVAAQLRVRVRTGVVELSDGSRTVTSHAGSEVLFSATEAESRPLSPHGPEWDWTAEAAPTIDIEGLQLSTYLDLLARERGWTVRYLDPDLAREAGGIILHGSVADLTATQALDVAIGASGLAYRLDDGQLVVFRETPR
jgi:ferric-dicitrate binding protein FerR (iron transport regulator)